MKITFLTVAVAALITLSGCGGGTSGGAGTGKGSILKGADDTFTLSPPKLATTLKQGESKMVTIGINRGKNFDQDVGLKFEGVPEGVSIEPAAPSIKHGDAEAKVTVKAAADAALGDFTVKVTGHPTKGTDGANEFKLTVKKK
jgi:uncharacterized membrane protein